MSLPIVIVVPWAARGRCGNLARKPCGKRGLPVDFSSKFASNAALHENREDALGMTYIKHG